MTPSIMNSCSPSRCSTCSSRYPRSVLAAAQLVFLVNFFVSIWAGKRATGNNPWQATTLEWETPCPTGHGNFGPELPTVHRWAFDYSAPGAKEDFLPQTAPAVPARQH